MLKLKKYQALVERHKTLMVLYAMQVSKPHFNSTKVWRHTKALHHITRLIQKEELK